uniref:Uncharacterized protein n=1 Tax=Chenopodium quinoa TaxID=63459 RepID=A0A803LIX7_CHEQI
MIEDLGDSTDPIPLHNVTSKILAKVIEYCNKHAVADNSESVIQSDVELKQWEKDFLNAANYMDIKGLLDLTCQCVANMIKGKTPEEIRKTFYIKNDFTPEEEEEVRRENQWAFEEATLSAGIAYICEASDGTWIEGISRGWVNVTWKLLLLGVSRTGYPVQFTGPGPKIDCTGYPDLGPGPGIGCTGSRNFGIDPGTGEERRGRHRHRLHHGGSEAAARKRGEGRRQRRTAGQIREIQRTYRCYRCECGTVLERDTETATARLRLVGVAAHPVSEPVPTGSEILDPVPELVRPVPSLDLLGSNRFRARYEIGLLLCRSFDFL